MSLASFLLPELKASGKKRAIDTELDDLFNSQAPLSHTESTSNDHSFVGKKNKRPSSALADPSSSSPLRKQKRSGNKPVRITPELESEPEFSDAAEAESSNSVSSHESSPETSDDHRDVPSTLIHETLQKDKLSKLPGRKANLKYVPSDETKERRDARTIFIGNLAPDVATKRPLQKQLRRHMLALLPMAKIESIRFRSVAFQTPTSKLPEASGEIKDKQPRQHGRDRASSWRNAHAADESKNDEKKFLTSNQKKKIAFINKDVHSDADSVHAYIVFAYPPSPHSRPANLPPPPLIMDPFEAARLAIEKCDGTMFLDRMLRVDAVTEKPTTKSSSGTTLLSSAIGDPKRTIFVGNLDFGSKEEDLRVFFEGIVSAERGPPDAEGLQDGDKLKCWVTRVRMIRDKDTQVGKGFAYVQFSDRTCVDEILAFEPGRLKFAKRKLRVQRCKSKPSTTSAKNAPSSKPMRIAGQVLVPPVPKGDPSLGERLVELTKEERKRVKAADADRVARRMAKKKARMELTKQGVPLQNKQRERVRKTSFAKRPDNAPLKKANKKRVRSEKSIAKMNTKK